MFIIKKTLTTSSQMTDICVVTANFLILNKEKSFFSFLIISNSTLCLENNLTLYQYPLKCARKRHTDSFYLGIVEIECVISIKIAFYRCKVKKHFFKLTHQEITASHTLTSWNGITFTLTRTHKLKILLGKLDVFPLEEVKRRERENASVQE